ncbi:SEC-C metal-binding domain-containing protein [Desulfosporosinus fructosivorans]
MAWFEEELPVTQPIKTGPKIGRNQSCPCGSGESFNNMLKYVKSWIIILLRK